MTLDYLCYMSSNRNLHAEFLQAWRSGQDEFVMHTSGSTGTPSQMIWKREHMKWSAEQTLSAFFNCCQDLSQLCVLPVDKAGGLMQAVRAEVWKTPIEVREARSLPNLEGQFSIVSLTPMQLYYVVQSPQGIESLKGFHTVLIGGGPIDPALEARLTEPDLLPVRFIHTFGMSETYSHFAGRIIGETPSIYRVLQGYEWKIDNEMLSVKSPATGNQWLQTNDRVRAEADRFSWLGRADFVVNSGGVKLSIESIEETVSAHLGWPLTDFFVWKIPDLVLGEALVLVHTQMETIEKTLDWSFLPPYHKPKFFYHCPNPVIANGKWQRAASFAQSRLIDLK
jgi:O-succinylbenzoic acid--CoA ligase